MSDLPAMKFDGAKPRTDLVPWDTVLEAAAVFGYGAAKYDDRNYYGLSQSRLYGATIRHLAAWWLGEDDDPESGHKHLSHALCGVMMLLEKELHELGEDDRPWSGRDREPGLDSVADAPRAEEESHGIGGKWAAHALEADTLAEQECADRAQYLRDCCS